GAAAVDLAVTKYGRQPEALTAALGLSVVFSDDKAQAGQSVYFSEYAEKRATITIYRQSIGEVNELIKTAGLRDLLGLEDVAPVHLAHEVYHHLELKGLTPGTRRFQVRTHSIGPLRLHTGLPSLSEIAADRFAAGILALAVPPRALQFITIYSRNADYAWDLLGRLKALPD
ncbi:MAG: hypothetical protein ACYC1C_09610, partial [Chloroflexota bacterium]